MSRHTPRRTAAKGKKKAARIRRVPGNKNTPLRGASFRKMRYLTHYIFK